MPDITPELLEAFRRRANLSPASTAGLPPGQANLNPMAQTPQQIMAPRLGQAPQPPAQGAGLPQNMSEGGINQLGKSAPGEAELILKALIQRLRSLGDRGQ